MKRTYAGRVPPGHAFEAVKLRAFRTSFRGKLILPADPDYGEARAIFNVMIDRRPAMIAQCRNADDVVRAIGFARDQGLEISVRGGGHSVAGMGLTDGGVVIDLRRMNAVHVDAAAGTATVEGGAMMGHLDRATAPFGLGTTGGRVSTTGVAGFTLGGGSGWFERKFGLACDNMVSVDLVTADGREIRASDDKNRDLFWGLHGGGGNFGVATSITLRLYPLPTTTTVMLLWTPEAAPEILDAYRDFMQTAPEEIGGGAFYLTAPEEPFVPQFLVGKLAFATLYTYAGPEAEARATVGPMLGLGHQGEMIAEMPYAALQSKFDDPPGKRNYWSAEHLASFPDEAVRLFCRRAADMLVPSLSQQIVFCLGGAVARNGADYPVPWRQAPWVIHPFGLWEDPDDDDRVRKWARKAREDMKPWSTGAVYLNFIGDEGEQRVRAGFGAENYRRLAAVKKAYDPDNIFHLNHNIMPA